jgi:hypothetical protein
VRSTERSEARKVATLRSRGTPKVNEKRKMKNDLSEINWQALKGRNLSAMGEAHRPGARPNLYYYLFF